MPTSCGLPPTGRRHAVHGGEKGGVAGTERRRDRGRRSPVDDDSCGVPGDRLIRGPVSGIERVERVLRGALEVGELARRHAGAAREIQHEHHVRRLPRAPGLTRDGHTRVDESAAGDRGRRSGDERLAGRRRRRGRGCDARRCRHERDRAQRSENRELTTSHHFCPSTTCPVAPDPAWGWRENIPKHATQDQFGDSTWAETRSARGCAGQRSQALTSSADFTGEFMRIRTLRRRAPGESHLPNRYRPSVRKGNRLPA